MVPLILVSTELRPADGYIWHAALDTYLKAITMVGAAPLMLPSLGDELDLPAILERVDGVLLTGSRSNVQDNRAILMDRRTTRFAGTAEDVTDDEVITAIKSVPCHY